MKLLLIKTSSMGDIVHTFPALTDAKAAIPGLSVEWVVEEGFADLAARHPAVDKVIPCAMRRWRKNPLKTRRSTEWKQFVAELGRPRDKVIDAQGLLKSAFLTRKTSGIRYGLDRKSAREPLSAWVLDQPQFVEKNLHAIERTRKLFALSLGYPLPESLPDYGLPRSAAPRSLNEEPAVILIHATTWPTKHWPEQYWQQLAEKLRQRNCKVFLPWGTEQEQQRAQWIAQQVPGVEVMERRSLDGLLDFMGQVDLFVAVDTGLAHLAAAAGLKGVALYGPTDPQLTGVLGQQATSLAADFPCAPCLQEKCTYKGEQGRDVFPPCFSRLPVADVLQKLELL